MKSGRFDRAYAALERFGADTFRRFDSWQTKMRGSKRAWPALPGAYVLGDPRGSLAVCTLTSNELTRTVAAISGVAIAGRLYTCNLGIEKIILNVCASPTIRALIVCGAESPVFHPGQALVSLFSQGIDADRRIVGAIGYLPALQGISRDVIERFRREIKLIDRTGLVDIQEIAAEVSIAASEVQSARASLGTQDHDVAPPLATPDDGDQGFVVLKPGGKREPLGYDPLGYFVFSLDRTRKEIIARHYTSAARPAHVVRGRSAEGIALGLIRNGLVTQMSHAAYVGAELSKAETALRIGLDYEQDHPLQRPA